MKAWGRLAWLVCAAAVLLAAPQAASAKSGYYVNKPSRFEILQVRASGGFHLNLMTFDGRYLSVLAERFSDVGSQSAVYAVRLGASDGDGIRASLDHLGRVALHFRPLGPAKALDEPDQGCKGRAPTVQNGVFEGVLRFHGERGFTSVDATSAKGQVLHSYRQACKRPHESGRGRGGRGGGQRGAVGLSVFVAERPSRPSLSVYEHGASSAYGSTAVSLAASVSERRGRIAISRSAFATAEASAFAFSAPGTSPVVASLAPPLPFTGSAHYERQPGGSASWSGDLGVTLPGRGPVPLTGPDYSAELCRGAACGCLPANGCVTFGSSPEVTVTGGDPRLQRLRSRYGL